MAIFTTHKQKVKSFVVSELSAEQRAMRLERIEAFKSMLKKYKITVREFARLTGIPEQTVYTWTSNVTSSCPPAYALRFLEVIGQVSEAREYLKKG